MKTLFNVVVMDFSDVTVKQYQMTQEDFDANKYDEDLDDNDVVEQYIDSLGHNLNECQWIFSKNEITFEL
jgi:hypothetical protein